MKKKLLLLFTVTFTTICFAQKIPVIKKEAIFKTPQYWQNLYASKLKTAPPEVLQKVNNFNLEAIRKGLTFKIGYTSKWGLPVEKITGAKMPDRSRPGFFPDPRILALPPRPNVVQLAATANDAYVDMRDYGIITPVRDQAGCGSCWAFGTIATLETGWLLKNGGDAGNIDLSEQQVLNCTGNGSCNGGWNNDASRFICEHRVAVENTYMYFAKDSACGNGNNSTSVFKGRKWNWVGSNTGELKQAIIEHGSVSSSVWVSDEMKNYAGGVYNLNNAPPFGQCNHLVQIIGWDDARQAWLIKNSWGEGWGEGGFAWIKYNSNYIGSHAVWVEAETTDDMNTLTNNPYTTTTGINFNSADYNTLKALYAKVAVYRMENRQSHKVLDCDDPVIGSGDKGHKMQQWSSHGQIFAGSDGHNQEWFFIEAGKRGEKPVYKIFNYGFNNFLQANAAGPRCENGNGLNNQLWYIMPQGSKSVVKIKSVETNQCLQVPAGDNNDGALIQLAAEGTGDNQMFDLNISNYNPNIETVRYRLMPKHREGSALDLTAGNLNNGTFLQIWDKSDGNPNQLWNLTFEGIYGYFRLHVAKDETKCVQVQNASLVNGGRIDIQLHGDGTNQDWLFIRMARDNDKFIIFNRNSAKCLDVTGVGTGNGTPMQQWEFVNNDNQKWKLEKK